MLVTKKELLVFLQTALSRAEKLVEANNILAVYSNDWRENHYNNNSGNGELLIESAIMTNGFDILEHLMDDGRELIGEYKRFIALIENDKFDENGVNLEAKI